MTELKENGKDGGYGWIIVIACFICNILQYGITWTVGVFYVIFLEQIGGNIEAVALISSLNTAMFFFAGNQQNIFKNFRTISSNNSE